MFFWGCWLRFHRRFIEMSLLGSAFWVLFSSSSPPESPKHNFGRGGFWGCNLYYGAIGRSEKSLVRILIHITISGKGFDLTKWHT